MVNDGSGKERDENTVKEESIERERKERGVDMRRRGSCSERIERESGSANKREDNTEQEKYRGNKERKEIERRRSCRQRNESIVEKRG